jgi:two-component system CheB/CheR fusion protein
MRDASATLRVLVVEDDRTNRECLGLLLRMWGHEVRLTGDGSDALETSQSFRPQVVLLDIGLPGLDGWEVARQLRQQEGVSPVLLVAMTGYARDEDRRRACEAGFDLHLAKPVDPARLKALLASGPVGQERACLLPV